MTGSRSSRSIASGEVVAEFFDIGQSRSLPWQRRPEASRLLDALADTRRGFDGVVIGEPHRAFSGNRFGLTFPLFVHYGVELWVPEIGGAIDPDCPDLTAASCGFCEPCQGDLLACDTALVVPDFNAQCQP